MTHFFQQPVAEKLLTAALAQDRLATAYLFTGPTGVGKFAAGLFVARALLCESPTSERLPCGECSCCRRVSALTHPDLHAIFPVPGSKEDDRIEPTCRALTAKAADPYAPVDFPQRPYHRMEVLRALIDELAKTPVEHRAKVVIFDRAERMRGDQQSLLLKTIEEPPPDAHIVLCSPDPDGLLPTVRSRCQQVRFHPVDPAAIAERLVGIEQSEPDGGVTPERARRAAALSGGGWGRARRLCDDHHEQLHALAVETLEAIFAEPTEDALGRVDKLPSGRKGWDDLLFVWDVWKYELVRRVRDRVTEYDSTTPAGIAVDSRRALDCAEIVGRGRRALWDNVNARTVLSTTVIELRRAVGIAL